MLDVNFTFSFRERVWGSQFHLEEPRSQSQYSAYLCEEVALVGVTELVPPNGRANGPQQSESLCGPADTWRCTGLSEGVKTTKTSGVIVRPSEKENGHMTRHGINNTNYVTAGFVPPSRRTLTNG